MAEKERKVIKETGGHFYPEESSQGWAVYKDGGKRTYEDGKVGMGLHIPVLVVSEWLHADHHEELVTTVAKLMNEAEGRPAETWKEDQ